MAFINGYKYTTENEAIIAKNKCSQYYGIPKNPEDITQYWCDYSFAELNEPQFWYITGSPSIELVLGSPIEFEVIIKPLRPDLT